jgi:hypothetical protein
MLPENDTQNAEMRQITSILTKIKTTKLCV